MNKINLNVQKTDNSNKEVGDRLRKFRKEELNLRQGAMAESLDLKQGSYSDIERGKAGISGIIVKLIMKYRINPIWLLEGIGIRRMNEPTLMLLCTEISEDQEIRKSTSADLSTLKLYNIIDSLQKSGMMEHEIDDLKKEISALMYSNSELEKKIEKLEELNKEYLNKPGFLPGDD